MTEPSHLPLPSTPSHQQIAAIAGPPPLTAAERERAAGYDELLARVSETLQPSDVLEHIWIRDIVDLAWDVFRLRRMKVDLVSAASWEGMAKVLEPLCEGHLAIARGWARRADWAMPRVEALFAAAEVTPGMLAAQTFAVRLGEIERVDRLLASAEARRNNALREIDLHRASFGLRLRHALQTVEDAEFNEIAPSGPAQESAEARPEAGAAEASAEAA